ncbi:hypothetical protein ACFU8Q_11070 [Streptomyces sp. NPDC057543]|uniref:hypothetical protein n=1 Tax=Streptomyces sp. NPDC057543 TaxID=3346163 RepID=UPI0036B8DEC9
MVSDTLARLSAPGVSIWLDDWRVSIGVDPRLAHDSARTVAEARALWWLVADQPNGWSGPEPGRSGCCRRPRA